MKIVIDGSNTILGRLCSYAAKQALLGKDVAIVNCKHVILSGDKRMVIKEYQTLMYRGGHSLKGPFHIKRNPERIVKRTIRGMLDYKYGRGETAFSKIKCYNDVPAEFAKEKMISIKKVMKRKTLAMSELVKEL